MHKLDPNYAYMFMQRGDQEIAPNKHKNVRLYDGMLGFLDPQMWKDNLVVLDDSYLGETCVVKLKRSWLPDLKTAATPYESSIIDPKTGMPAIGADSRRCKRWIDPKQVAPLANTPDFLTKYYKHKAKIDIVDGTAWSKTFLKDTALTDFAARPVIADVGQITAGNYTIGPVGANYPTFGGPGGGWAALGNLTGNLTFTQIGNVVETAQATGTITLGGFVLNNTSNAPHRGDPTRGWTIDINFDGNAISHQFEGPGTYRYHELHIFYRTAQAALTRSMHRIEVITTAFDGYFYNLLLDQNANRGVIINVNDNTPILYFYNIVGWDATAAAFGVGFLGGAINANSVLENNTFYNCRINYNANNQGGTYRNNTAYDSITANSNFTNIGGATGRFNLSTDATAADGGWLAGLGNIINTPAANCVQGVNAALANFMDILSSGALDGAGEANVIAERTACIRNRTVPGPNGTSIGPAEIPFPTGKICVPSRASQVGMSIGIGL